MKLPAILGTPQRRWQMGGLVALGAVRAAIMIVAAVSISAYLEASPGSSAWLTLIALLGLGVLTLGLQALSRAMAERFGLGYVAVCRVRLLKSIVRNGGTRGRHGLAMTRMISDLNSLKGWIGVGIAEGSANTALLLGLFIGAAFLSTAAVFALLAAACVSTLIAMAVLYPLRHAIQDSRRARGKLAARVGEAVLTASTIRTTGGLDRERSRMYARSERLSSAATKRYFFASLLQHGPELGFLAGIALLGFSLLSNPALSWETTAPSLLILSAAGTALRGLARCLDHWLTYREGRHRIIELLSASGPRSKPWRAGEPLGVDLVRLCLEKGDPAINLQIPPGSVVHIPAMSRNTLILRAVAGLQRPHRGRILLRSLDGTTRDACSTSLAASLVSPDVPLQSGTVLSNLRTTMVQGDDMRLQIVAKHCGLLGDEAQGHEILQMPIAEAGRRLTRSFAARLRLARALLADPGVLIIDDPVFEIDQDCQATLRRLVADAPCTILFNAYGEEMAAEFDHRLEDMAGEAHLRPLVQAGRCEPALLRRVS